METLMAQGVSNISAKKTRESGTQRAKKRFRGHNVIWRRITAAFDEELRQFGANPAMVAPLSRWVLFGHLSKSQGAAGRYYAGVVKKFDRYCVPIHARTPRSPSLEPLRAEDEELERRIRMGTLDQYEHDAKFAKSQYRRVMKILDAFADPITGRNLAKDALDQLCLSEEELPSSVRKDVGVVLTALAKEFGIGEYKPKANGK
jgi:hypothetical protein